MIKSSSRHMAGLILVLCSLSATASLAAAVPALAETCPNEEFRTGPSANLPDCRAYELVTPPFKEAAIAPLETSFSLGGLVAISPDGSQLALQSLGNFGDTQGTARTNDYEMTRTASGWSETDIDIPLSRFPASEIVASEEREFAAHGYHPTLYASHPIRVTPNFEKFLYQSPHSVYVNDNGGPFWIAEADGALRRLGSGEGAYTAASEDLSLILFDSGGPQGPLEEENSAGGAPVPVGVDSEGSLCSAEYSGRSSGSAALSGAISADGSAVFFNIPAGGCSAGTPSVTELFARLEESRTVAISEPSTTDCSVCDTSSGVLANPEYDGISADGSKAFFTTTQPLLGSDTENSANIYEYDFDAPQASPGAPDGRLIQVTAGRWAAGGAQVRDVARISEDGSHVYFVAAGALEGMTNDQGQHPIEGGENLYVFERDAQFPDGRLSFIATANPENPSTTPDGQLLVFLSSVDLTPGDTSTAQQVFEYDAETGSLVRCSIGQNGFNDNGNTDTFNAGIPQDAPHQSAPGLAVSNDGAYVVFESPDGLTPGALNGYHGEIEYELEGGSVKQVDSYYAENVYEYHDGSVYLISDGQDTSFSLRHQFEGGSSVQVRGISPSGDDIFFETADRLTPADVDTQKDLYDARIAGGFPAPVSALPTCTGDACQGQLSPSPVLLSPGSEFQAGGNPPLTAPAPTVKPKSKPVKCRTGFAKKHGKCVRVTRKTRAKTKGTGGARRAK